MTMDIETIQACFTQGREEYKRILLDGYLKPLDERVSQCLSSSGVSAREIQKLILGVDPEGMTEEAHQMAMILQVQEKLKCNTDQARECMCYSMLAGLADAYMHARITQLQADEKDFNARRNREISGATLRDYFWMMTGLDEAKAGLGEVEVKSVLREFDQAFDAAVTKQIGITVNSGATCSLRYPASPRAL